MVRQTQIVSLPSASFKPVRHSCAGWRNTRESHLLALGTGFMSPPSLFCLSPQYCLFTLPFEKEIWHFRNLGACWIARGKRCWGCGMLGTARQCWTAETLCRAAATLCYLQYKEHGHFQSLQVSPPSPAATAVSNGLEVRLGWELIDCPFCFFLVNFLKMRIIIFFFF